MTWVRIRLRGIYSTPVVQQDIRGPLEQNKWFTCQLSQGEPALFGQAMSRVAKPPSIQPPHGFELEVGFNEQAAGGESRGQLAFHQSCELFQRHHT